MGRLRLSRESPRLYAGTLILLSVLLGGVVYAYLVQGGPMELAEGFYSGSGVMHSSDQFLKTVRESGKPVAVMFSSKTCPVCRMMEPYWKPLCEREDLPVDFRILMLNRDTTQLFLDYGVTETPTFILFIDGEPVARHVGGFVGDNLTEVMIRWALASAGDERLLEEDLELFKRHCSSCHGAPNSLGEGDVDEWIQANPRDGLVSKLEYARRLGVPLSEYYGGVQGLASVVMGMANVTGEEAYRIALLLDSMTTVHEARGNATMLSQGGEIQVMASTLAALLAGLMASLSPCVFPLLLAYTTTTMAAGRRLGGFDGVKGMAASAAGVGAVGLLFLILGDRVAGISNMLMPAAGLAILASGILGYMDIPAFINMGASTRRGILGFSFLYGLLSVQCSFPLVAGALMIIAAGGLSTGLPSLIAFSLGVSLPVGLAITASSYQGLRRAMERLGSGRFKRNGYLILAFMGFILLAYSLKLV
ncbi:MAG: thioredoxin domain-containing protein [Desulfurococcales archaeon]|nr:thioredoxin domain-containing protein [Desulfurococcales archaeon]